MSFFGELRIAKLLVFDGESYSGFSGLLGGVPHHRPQVKLGLSDARFQVRVRIVEERRGIHLDAFNVCLRSHQQADRPDDSAVHGPIERLLAREACAC